MKRDIKNNNGHLDSLKKSKWFKPIIIVLLCTLFTSAGQIFYKTATSHSNGFIGLISTPALYIGAVLYIIGAVLLIIALKYGELSVIYPFIALSFVWVPLASIYFFNDHITFINWLGIFSVIIGVSIIGYGSTK